MEAYRIETTISENGTLNLDALPFAPGERVEVIVLSLDKEVSAWDRHPLRGSVLRYERPTDPVAEDDWEALK